MSRVGFISIFGPLGQVRSDDSDRVIMLVGRIGSNQGRLKFTNG